MIKVVECSLRRDIIPASLYGGKPYQVTGTGLEIPRVIKEEAEYFLKGFMGHYYLHEHPIFRGHPPHPSNMKDVYLRLDFFVDPSLKNIHLLEVNSRFVDGWGSSLNLARAIEDRRSNVDTKSINVRFPLLWYLPPNNQAYRAEFDLALDELRMIGAGERLREAEGIVVNNDVPDMGQYSTHGPYDTRNVYYYGWDHLKDNYYWSRDKVSWVPTHRFELENKLLLAEFSQYWGGTRMQIPRFYCWPDPWDIIPKDRVIWKFCEKGSPDSMRVGTNIVYPSELGKGKFVRQCYQRKSVIAQDLVPTFEAGDMMCQLILLAAEGKIVTGYTLWAPRGTRVITDAYSHGPLIWGD